ncbi:helix-turn-helix domain-containing protein [Nocardia niigatensis]
MVYVAYSFLYHLVIEESDQLQNLARRLREYRVAKFLTQEELADLSGVSRPTIARIESGTAKPRPRTVRKLAAALGIEPGNLVERPQHLWQTDR